MNREPVLSLVRPHLVRSDRNEAGTPRESRFIPSITTGPDLVSPLRPAPISEYGKKANAGSVFNEATATGTSPAGVDVTDTDDLTVTVVQHPEISIVKSLASYDDNDGSLDISNGDGLWYQFLVTNEGDVTLDPVSVTDDTFGISVTCSDTSLDPGDSVTCTADAAHLITLTEANAGSVFNEATATGTSPAGVDVTDTDDLTVTVVQHPEIDVEKLVSIDGGATWIDADAAPGPFVTEGADVLIRFVVTNTGDVTLSGITLTDSDFDLSTCVIVGSLDPSGSFECVITVVAPLGQHTDTATATGTSPAAVEVIDTDDANFYALGQNQPSIQIEDVTVDTFTATHVEGTILISDQSEMGPDFEVAITELVQYVEWKRGGKNWNVIETTNCTYDWTDASGDSGVGLPIVFNDTVTIDYSCDLVSAIPDNARQTRLVTEAGIFGRTGRTFTYRTSF